MGLGLDANDKKKLQNCIEDMALIGGQKPVVTNFKKSSIFSKKLIYKCLRFL